MSGTDYITTPNLGLYKPISNRAIGTWGDLWNANADALDAAIAGSGASIINVLDKGARGDGTTDDTDAIQGVLNTYAGKATVFIPETGHPYMCFPLVPQTGTDMLILGTLKLRPASPNALIVVNSGTSRVTLRGNGVLDGNASAQTNAVGNVYLNGSSNLRLSGLTLQNSKEWNLNVVGCSDVVVDGVTMLGGTASNEFAAACDDCWLTNCTIDGPSGDIGFSFYGGVTHSGAIGNVIRNSGVAGKVVVDGINVLCDAAQSAPCTDLIIADNIIYNSYGGGISIARGTGGTGLHQRIMVNNNRCYNNGNIDAVYSIGDFGTDCSISVEFIGNQSTNLLATTAYGFYVGSNATTTSIVGNQVNDIGTGTTTGYGLYINSANIVFASGNQFADNHGTHVMTNAIGGVAGLRNAFVGNFCDLPNALTLQADTVMSNVVAGHQLNTLPVNATNDAAAASAGVPVGGTYRNGSISMIRVA
jgi:hypothetical protein